MSPYADERHENAARKWSLEKQERLVDQPGEPDARQVRFDGCGDAADQAINLDEAADFMACLLT